MKKLLCTTLSLAACLSSPAQASGMVQGIYGGLMGTVSSASSTQENVFSPLPMSALVPGTVKYSIGGGGGLQLGYRYNHFRFEAQLLGNYNGINTLTLPGLTINKKSQKLAQSIAVSGDAIMGAGFLNAYFDVNSNQDIGDFSPYVGIGVGYTRVSTTVNYWRDTNGDSIADTKGITALSQTSSSAAGQAILGISYALDSYTTIALDGRYIAAASSNKNKNSASGNKSDNFGAGMLNFIFNVSFDGSANA